MMKKVGLKISIGIFAYGVFFNNPFLLENTEKAILGIFLYSIPLIVNLLKKPGELTKVYSIWFGIFMILQSVLFFKIFNTDYVTLPPNLVEKVDVKEGVLSNIKGIQNIKTDEKGFRVTKKINYDNKPDNNYRIFAIGGSTTEQIYLDQNLSWTHLLQEKLDQEYQDLNFEVINTGVSGLRANNHIATLKKILKYNPDMAIFLIGINDWNHDIKNNHKSGYKKFKDNLPDFVTGLSYDKTLRKFIKSLKKKKQNNSNNNRELKEIYFAYGSLNKDDKRSYRPQGVLDSYKEELNEIDSICKKNQINCVFLTQPNGYKELASKQYKDLFWMTPPEEEYTLKFEDMSYISNLYNEYMIDFAKNSKNQICDLNSKIPASLDYMYDDCHFNIKGAKKVSDILFDCIEIDQN